MSLTQKKAYDASQALNTLLPTNRSLSAANLRASLVNIVLQNIDNGFFVGYVYPTTAETVAAAAIGDINNSKCYIDASTGNVYAYLAGTHKLIEGLKAKDVYPTPCQLRTGANVWNLAKDGTLTKV